MYGKIKFMFQTTHQLKMIHVIWGSAFGPVWLVAGLPAAGEFGRHQPRGLLVAEETQATGGVLEPAPRGWRVGGKIW